MLISHQCTQLGWCYSVNTKPNSNAEIPWHYSVIEMNLNNPEYAYADF